MPLFRYHYPQDSLLTYTSTVRQVQTTLLEGHTSVAESYTRSRFSYRALEVGELVLKVELTLESVEIELLEPAHLVLPLAGLPRSGILRMEKNGRVLEEPSGIPVGRGLVFPDFELLPGDVWRVAQDLGSGRAVVEHCFDGWAEADGRECAVFTSSLVEYAGSDPRAFLEGILEGELLFDAEQGRVQRSLLSYSTRFRKDQDEQVTQVACRLELVPTGRIDVREEMPGPPEARES